MFDNIISLIVYAKQAEPTDTHNMYARSVNKCMNDGISYNIHEELKRSILSLIFFFSRKYLDEAEKKDR